MTTPRELIEEANLIRAIRENCRVYFPSHGLLPRGPNVVTVADLLTLCNSLEAIRTARSAEEGTRE